MRTISSQRHLDASIVEAKRAACDYAAQRVLVEVEGEELYVVVDGHHSIAAAVADEVDVAWEPAHPEVQSDADRAIDAGTEAVADWMATRQLDSDWYDIATGRDAW